MFYSEYSAKEVKRYIPILNLIYHQEGGETLLEATERTKMMMMVMMLIIFNETLCISGYPGTCHVDQDSDSQRSACLCVVIAGIKCMCHQACSKIP